MAEERVREKLENYRKALARLGEALSEKEPDQYVYDAVIKRFEFTYELSWKLMKTFIDFKGGEDVRFPRDIFKEAYAKGLLKYGEVWLDMMNDRNLSSHTYDQEKAKDIYVRVKERYLEHFQQLAQTVEGGME